jgi:hypothetical protein
MTRFHAIMVVWGDDYTRHFLDVVLPGQLSACNLPSLQKDGAEAIYQIYTTSRDAETIRQAPVFARLSAVLPVAFTLIDDLLLGQKHQAMIESHRRAIRSANAERAALIFLAPDAIFPGGTFRRIREICESGKRVIANAGLRVVKDSFVPWYRSRFGSGSDSSAPVPGRDLIREALNQLHPLALSMHWDSPKFTRWPANIYWPVGREGLVVRAFHLHPLMIHPVDRDAVPTTTVDDDYISRACPDPKDWHVVRDSDEIVHVDITGIDEYTVIPSTKASPFGVAFWSFHYARPHHRELFHHPIRIHHSDPSSEWENIEARVARIASSIDAYLRHPYLLMGWKMILRSATLPLRKPLQALLGSSRLENLRRALRV